MDASTTAASEGSAMIEYLGSGSHPELMLVGAAIMAIILTMVRT